MNIKRNKNLFLIIALFVSLSFTTIVYSAFNTQLQISGEAIVRTEKQFRITGLELVEATNNAYETYSSKYEKDTTSLYVTLPASSSMTYEIEITNKNDKLMYRLEKISHLMNNNPNVKVEYSIKTGDCVLNNSKKTFTIKLTNNTSAEQTLTLITQFQFKLATFAPLETNFLSSNNSGDLSENEEGVIFEVSVTNINPFTVNYSLTSDDSNFVVIDDATKKNTFQIEPNATVTHQIRVKLRDDVVYEHFTENLKLMAKTTYPKSRTTDIKTVVLNLPRNSNTIILNTMSIKDSPASFTSSETENGYLFRINEMTSSSYTYYYRGVVNNNYFLFADNLWRIVRIDANGNIRLVLNDNVSTTSQYSNNYVSGNVENIEAAIPLVDYKNSNVRKDVEAWYNQNIAPKEASKYVVNSKFCVDLNYQDPFDTQYQRGVHYFTPYLHVGVDSKKFTPNFSCANENIFTNVVGLLSAEEVLAAGGYWEQENKNYYLYNPNKSDDSQTSWTLSGSYYSIYEKQAGAIVFNQQGKGLFDWVLGGNLAQYYGYRPVISLKGTITMSGDGTIDNPYKIVK